MAARYEDKSGAIRAKDKSWVYRGTIGGAGFQTTTILGTENGYKSYSKDRKLRAWKLRKKRRKYWRQPWVGDSASNNQNANKTGSQNAKEGRAGARAEGGRVG